MQEGILNEPVRENAKKLLESFGDQMGLQFDHLMFIAVTPEGEFRTANFAEGQGLTVEAIKLIAKHLKDWADQHDDDLDIPDRI